MESSTTPDWPGFFTPTAPLLPTYCMPHVCRPIAAIRPSTTDQPKGMKVTKQLFNRRLSDTDCVHLRDKS